MKSNILCGYGCGNTANYKLSKRYCCSDHYSRCPENKRKNSEGLKNSTVRCISNNPTSKKYWTSRGYSESDASNEIRKRKSACPEYWMKLGYDDVESVKLASSAACKSNSGNINYWLNKGLSQDEALKKHNETISIMSNRMSNRSTSDKRRFNNLTTEFWMSRGYTEEEAISEVKKVQHNRFDYFSSIKKGVATRLHNWYELSTSERSLIRRATHHNLYDKLRAKTHSPIFIQYWLSRGFDEKDSRSNMIKTKHVINPTGRYSSKIENRCFEELGNFLGVSFDAGHLTINDNHYIPDRIYGDNIFEFNGTRPHLDGRFHKLGDVNPWGSSFETIKTYDKNKISNYLTKYNVYVIWEHDFKNNKDLVFNSIKNNLFVGNNDKEYKESRVLWDSSCL